MTLFRFFKKIMWQKIYRDNSLLMVWPDCSMKNDDVKKALKGIESIDVTIVGSVQTIPDKKVDGSDIPGTGGRTDIFFWLHSSLIKDTAKYSVYGIRWWGDVYYHDQQSMYPFEFRKSFPNPWFCDSDESED